jgi:TFIIF-interacting CTD phosphatase-like protein
MTREFCANLAVINFQMLGRRVLSRLIMGSRPTTRMLSRGFFWSKKKKDSEVEVKEQEIKDMDNLSFLIEKVKQDNEQFQPLLPKKSPKDNKLTVCIEMDDVFLFSYTPDELEGYLYKPRKDHDIFVDLPEYNTSAYIYKRENMKELFDYLRDHTEAVLFCTGSQPYVDKIIKAVDPENTVFKYRLYQDSCNKIEYKPEEIDHLTKDLNRLGRDMKRTVMIDTKPFIFWCNPDNGIPISEYHGTSLQEPDLLQLVETLKELQDMPDVRPALQKKYFIRDALRESNLL